jgi:NAD(P)-dependent dehydrogenase (short-subunit alcohol dehydrogenase family)
MRPNHNVFPRDASARSRFASKERRASNQVVFITGASKRLGREIALFFANHGMRTALHYRHSKKEALQLAEQINRARPGTARAFQADLNDVRQIKKIVAEAGKYFKKIDILINNASIYEKNQFGKTTLDDWDRHLNANLRAPFFLAQEVIPWMKKEGQIINIADWAGLRPYADFIPYCVSKAGLLCLNTALAKALAPRIRVNAILPGPILLPEKSSPRFKRAVIEATPLKRIGAPKDIVKAVAFLVESGSFMTGAQISVDGGRLIA